jgi:hypothetical protein
MTAVVISRLACGLGNQLFQYAAALGVAHASGATPMLDASGFDAGTEERSYSLDRYDLGVPVLHGGVFDPGFQTVSLPAQPGLAEAGIAGALDVPVCRENNYAFEPHVMAGPVPVYLHGFWQSWKYFDAVSETLRDRLSVPPRPSSRNDALVAAIRGSPAVSIHVRRGDYATAYNQTIFGLCAPDYYRVAMTILRDRIDSPRFFVFSDDPEWCRRHFRDPDTTIAPASDGDARDDLAMMSHCRHHIIANSSLSWWGAWLGWRRGSVIVAPIPWYSQSPHTPDLIPKDWIRLDRRTGEDWSLERSRLGMDKVSVIVLARSDPGRLRRALRSVAAQDHPNIEIIVAPIGQRPCPSEPARETGDLPLIQAGRPDCGRALHAAIDRAEGAWLAFLDDGDVWLPHKLRTQVETAHLTDADVVVCRTIPMPGPAGLPEIFPPPGPPNCSLKQMVESGSFISGISHILARRQAAAALGPLDATWRPDTYARALQDLVWQPRAVLIWDRLVKSPIPYMDHRPPGRQGKCG